MIRLICTNCRAALEIDDAFAGGVCRCQHCGTIQTVPRTGESQGATPGKSLYQAKPRHSGARRGPGDSAELDTLAEIVASSGLSGSGLAHGGHRQKRPVSYATPQAQKKSMVGLWIALGALALLAIGAGGMFFFGRVSQSTPTIENTPAGSGPSGPGVPVAPTGPVFANLPLRSQAVIYLVDRGDSTRDYFGDMKPVVLKSIQSLGPDRKFQIICWDNGEAAAYPPRTMSFAMEGEVKSVGKWLDDLFASGQTEIGPSLKTALAQNPGEIVIVTGKAWQLDADFAQAVLEVVGKNKVVIHTVALGLVTPDDPLGRIATKTGGKSAVLSAAEFHAAAE